MATILQGDPYNLQGNNQPLQGGYNPQGFVGPVLQAPQPAPVAPKSAPVAAPAPKPIPVSAQPQKINLSDRYGLVGSTIYDKTQNRGLSLEEFKAATGIQNPDWKNIVLDINYKPAAVQASPNPVPAAPITPPVAPAVTDPNQALAQAAAQAGLSVSDYLNLISGQSGVSADEVSTIRKNLGIDELEESVFAPPSKTTEQIYQDAYAQAGLADIKARIADLDRRIAEKKQKYTDKAGDINENPFLSEATRVGRLKNITDQGNAEIGNLLDEYDQYANLYNQGLGEVNNLVTRISTDFTTNQNINAQKLQYLLQKAEEQTKTLQSQKASAAYTYLPDFLKAKVKSQKPETIGSAETGFFAWDPNTGTFTQVIEPQLKLTDDQKEYAFAVQQGYQGSFLAYQRDLANLKASIGGSSLGTELSNTMKMLQIQLLTQQVTGTKPLSGEAAKTKGVADTLIPELEKLKSAFEQDYKGAVAGIVVGTNRELSKLVDNVADKVGRLRSGGAINKEEEKRFTGQIASWKDLVFGNKDQAIKALDGILAEALTVQSGIAPYQNQDNSFDPATLAALLGGVQIQ